MALSAPRSGAPPLLRQCPRVPPSANTDAYLRMEQPNVRARAMAVYGQGLEVARSSLAVASSRSAELWAVYRPTTLIGWTAFAGSCMLALSALSTALAVLSGVLLALAWIGVGVYTVLVFFGTGAAIVVGSATVFFSATCAVVGTCVVSGACAAYACSAAYSRVRAAVQTYLATMQQVVAASANHQPALPPPTKAAAQRQLAAAAPNGSSDACEPDAAPRAAPSPAASHATGSPASVSMRVAAANKDVKATNGSAACPPDTKGSLATSDQLLSAAAAGVA